MATETQTIDAPKATCQHRWRDNPEFKAKAGKNLPILIPQLRGGQPYDRYLDALLVEATNRGHPVTNRTQLAELALNRLGETWGIKAPRRARPVGANQHGEPQAK